MELHECLRAELDEVCLIVDAVAPEIASPRLWVCRLMSRFAGLVI